MTSRNWRRLNIAMPWLVIIGLLVLWQAIVDLFGPERFRDRRLVLDAEAVVATTAGSTTSFVAEISKNEGAAATGRVRVFLHGVELCEISTASPIEHRPLHLEGRQRRSRVGEASPPSDALPGQELP